jgi:hypothetical protein
MKKCFKCLEFKDIDDFYKHSKMADGHLNKCKTCSQKDCSDRIKIKSLDRDWILKEKLRCRIKSNLNRKSLTKEEKKQSQDKYCEKYPEKLLAHRAVYKAIKNGNLIKLTCEICGEIKSEAHHDDYSKPLDIRWLCDYDHKQFHIQQRDINK